MSHKETCEKFADDVAAALQAKGVPVVSVHKGYFSSLKDGKRVYAMGPYWPFGGVERAVKIFTDQYAERYPDALGHAA